MPILTITARAQITLTNNLLRHLVVQPGGKLAVDQLARGRIAMKAAGPAGKISDVFNFPRRVDGPVLSITEMEQFVAEGWSGKR
jgi:hypothetical protein